MVRRRISAAQLKSQLRQVQNKLRQAANKHKQAARNVERDLKTAVNKHNQLVRTHNARVRTHQQRVKQELARLGRRASTTRYSSFRVSVDTVHDAYLRYESQASGEADDPRHALLLDLAEREDANSLAVMNALLDEEPSTDLESGTLQSTQIGNELLAISEDLDRRWRGAVYALSPQNPDAARHFCTSAREVFVRMLDLGAPDADVLREIPSCAKTQDGKPTRREKVRYVLGKKGLVLESLTDFVEKNVENVLELFGVFNSGTHGPAGTHDIGQLSAIKLRVEEGILFLASLTC